jgi:homoserine O-acetyltransferase
MRMARKLGVITYRSALEWDGRFGRVRLESDRPGDDAFGLEFQVESYLQYQGRSFSKRFDANTYLLMTRALDYFDPAREFGDDLVAAFRGASASFLVLSFTTDWRFSSERSREIVRALIRADRDVSHADIEAPQGHDAFLLPIPRYVDSLGAYMGRVADEAGMPARSGAQA